MVGRTIAGIVLVALVMAPLVQANEPVEREIGPPRPSQQSSLGVSPRLLEMRVDELIGLPVENQLGASVGEVTAIVIAPGDQRLYAIIDVIGGLDVVKARAAVPLTDLEVFNETLTVETGLDWPDLADHYAHDAAQFTPVQDDLLIRDVGGWWSRRVYDELTTPPRGGRNGGTPSPQVRRGRA